MCLYEFGSTDIALCGCWKRKFVNTAVRICLMGRGRRFEETVFCAQTTTLCQITRRHAPFTPSANTTNRRLPQETVNILSSWTTISVWGTAVCPQDITAVTKRCATSFSSGILSGAPVMSRAHNNAPARLQVFK